MTETGHDKMSPPQDYEKNDPTSQDVPTQPSRSFVRGPVDAEWSDLVLLIHSFTTGMVDAASYSNWAVFVGMQVLQSSSLYSSPPLTSTDWQYSHSRPVHLDYPLKSLRVADDSRVYYMLPSRRLCYLSTHKSPIPRHLFLQALHRKFTPLPLCSLFRASAIDPPRRRTRRPRQSSPSQSPRSTHPSVLRSNRAQCSNSLTSPSTCLSIRHADCNLATLGVQ